MGFLEGTYGDCWSENVYRQSAIPDSQSIIVQVAEGIKLYPII